LRELKNCIGGGFWRFYMNSNSIYVVIVFLKLKIYQSYALIPFSKKLLF
jgi:hypothetical protein